MSKRFYSFCFSSALAGLMFSLSGCGGGDSGTQVASAPAASNPPAQTSSPPPSENSAPSKSQLSYGSEDKTPPAGNSGGSGGNSGGGMGGERANGAIGDEGSYDGGPSAGGNSGGMMGNSGGMMGNSGGMSSGGTPSSGGMGGATRGPRGPGSGGMSGGPGSSGMSGGYGGESMSSGFGSEPFGGNAGPDLSMLTAFVQNNCAGCHANGSAKGGVSLDRVGPDLKQDARLWKSVLRALETSSMPPRNSRQPDPTRKAAVVELIRQVLGEEAGPAEEPSFMERAETAYRKGEKENAMSLFYAALLTASDSEAAELANNFKLYKPNPAKPEDLTPANDKSVAVKNKLMTELPIAIGVYLKLGQGVTEVKPVGVNQAGGAGGGMGGDGPGPVGMGGGGRSGGGGGAGGGGKLDAFEDLTGVVGETIVSAFSSRRSSGKFGTLFSNLTEDDPSALGFGGGFDPGMGSSGMGEGASEGGLAGGVGMGGGAAAPGRGGRGMGGGMSAPGGMGGGMGMGMGGEGGPAKETKTMAGKSLTNGLTYIGKADNINTLLKKAQDAGVDGLIVVEVDAKRERNFVSNETRFRFYLPSGRVVAASSKAIKNTDFEMGKQDTEFIQKQVDQMFARMDSVLNVIDLPQIPALSAMKQIQSKLHAGADRLQILAEARMYHAKGIITTDQLETAYQVILEGNEGVALAKGSEEDRKMVLTTYTEKL